MHALIGVICMSLAFTVPASAEGYWGEIIARADGKPSLAIYDPCSGPGEVPGEVLDGECVEAGIECSATGVRTWIKVDESMLGRWIGLETDFASTLTVGDAPPIELHPYTMSFNDIDGTWNVASVTVKEAFLPTEPGDIRIDIGIDTLAVSATGRNLTEIRTLLEQCAAVKASAPKQCTDCPPI